MTIIYAVYVTDDDILGLRAGQQSKTTLTTKIGRIRTFQDGAKSCLMSRLGGKFNTKRLNAVDQLGLGINYLRRVAEENHWVPDINGSNRAVRVPKGNVMYLRLTRSQYRQLTDLAQE
jgi:hypothetical protein